MNANREFIITFVDGNGNEFCKRFRTMKQFADYFNDDQEPLLMLSITEVPGSPVYDKYFKNFNNTENKNDISKETNET